VQRGWASDDRGKHDKDSQGYLVDSTAYNIKQCSRCTSCVRVWTSYAGVVPSPNFARNTRSELRAHRSLMTENTHNDIETAGLRRKADSIRGSTFDDLIVTDTHDHSPQKPLNVTRLLWPREPLIQEHISCHKVDSEVPERLQP
jgi:hypothetical protein